MTGRAVRYALRVTGRAVRCALRVSGRAVLRTWRAISISLHATLSNEKIDESSNITTKSTKAKAKSEDCMRKESFLPLPICLSASTSSA